MIEVNYCMMQHFFDGASVLADRSFCLPLMEHPCGMLIE